MKAPTRDGSSNPSLPFRSYTSYIRGLDVPDPDWTYCIDAAAQIDDPVAAMTRAAGPLSDADASAQLDYFVYGRCGQADADIVDAAVTAAAEAAPVWARFPLSSRLDLGRRVHAALLAHREDLMDILIAEGHPRRLAAWEYSGMTQTLDPDSIAFYATQMESRHDVPGRRISLVRKPDGVVCLNPPANAAASNATTGVPALMAGNALVVKAPRTTPLGVFYLFRDIVAPVLDAIGAPAGTLNIVSGGSQSILKQWMEHPGVSDILFFGSSETGLQVGRDCVARGKKPILELAGNDCCVVWRDADIDLAVDALLEAFYGSGQICMVPNWAVVHPEVADKVCAQLAKRAAELRPGYPNDPETVLTPVGKMTDMLGMFEEAMDAGATLLTGGHRIDVHGRRDEKGLFVEPTVLRVDGLSAARSLRCVNEETFFPLLPIVVADECVGLAEVIAVVNANRYGLRNSLFARDEEVIAEFCAGVSNGGQLKVNDSHISFGPVVATHGGTGFTGGPFGELNYPILRTTHLQGIAIADSISDAKVNGIEGVSS